MKPAVNIESLRRHIEARERCIPVSHPVASLGFAAMDRALPGGGLATDGVHEIFPATARDFSAGAGFVLCLLMRIARVRGGKVLWALPAHRSFHEGALYPPGLAALGFDPDRLIQVEAKKAVDILWALEEGLSHGGLCAAVGILPEGDRFYDFATSRRLALRARLHGVSALILRAGKDTGMSTAAETRWRVKGSQEARHGAENGGRAPVGAPRWRVELIKSKKGASGFGSGSGPTSWDVVWNHETLSFDPPAALADRAPRRAPGAQGRRWAQAS